MKKHHHTKQANPRHQAQDEQIIATIVAAGETMCHVLRGGFAGPAYDPSAPVYPSCAVGAGLLYAGMSLTAIDAVHNVCGAFARKYGVSELYAMAVSDGFEGCIGGTRLTYSEIDQNDTDYVRGWAVGSAIASALLEGDA